jgi:ribosomal protein S18 acetylase RimI-like enzyme
MIIKSLGYRTDLFFPQFDGHLINRGDHLVVLTPSNPTYHWGNFLLFAQPPGQGDFERWKTIFEREFRTQPDTHHMAFGWDTITGEIGEVEPFIKNGFNLNRSVVLSTQHVHSPPKLNQQVVIRPIAQDWEWDQALDNQIACRETMFSLAGYTIFKQQQMVRYRNMVSAGWGQWFGAFLDNRLVADLGLFCRDGIGRYQSVGTHPDFRRRGICGTLVYQAANYGFEHLGAQTLVMIAAENYHAAKIYESVGFTPTEHLAALDWWQENTG